MTRLNQEVLRWSALTSLTMAAAGAFVIWRVLGVNPAILGDEWVYLVSSRHYEMWSPEAAGLGNYLFNFLYSSTILCGDSFYQCAKGLNLLFFGTYVIFLILTLRDFANKWLATAFGIAVFLSPLSVYVSMYLPETLFFALIGGAIFFLSKSLQTDTPKMWIVFGAFLGLAALTKPHALLSAMGLGIFLLILAISRKGKVLMRLRPVFLTFGSMLAVRIGLGFLLGGPSALSLLTSYNSGEAIATLVENGTGPQNFEDNLVGAGQVAGALGLFPDQAMIHLTSLTAIVGIAIAVVLARFLKRLRSNETQPVDQLSLAALVWLGSMVIVIVLFTGWITGGGDDHTTRVLLRYYDFLLPMICLVAIALVSEGRLRDSPLAARWVPAGLGLVVSANAFTGFFNSLTVQIADAPFLAGLIVDRIVYDSVSIIGFGALITLAFFPKWLAWSLSGAVLVTFPMMGFISQSQYIAFRGQDNGPDLMGKTASDIIPAEQRDLSTVVAQSRFDGRTISFWMDADNELMLVPAGTAITTESINPSHEYLVVDSSMALGVGLEVIADVGGYFLVQVSKD